MNLVTSFMALRSAEPVAFQIKVHNPKADSAAGWPAFELRIGWVCSSLRLVRFVWQMQTLLSILSSLPTVLVFVYSIWNSKPVVLESDYFGKLKLPLQTCLWHSLAYFYSLFRSVFWLILYWWNEVILENRGKGRNLCGTICSTMY